MRILKCPKCHKRREAEGYTIMLICRGCQEEMVEKREVKEDGRT